MKPLFRRFALTVTSTLLMSAAVASPAPVTLPDLRAGHPVTEYDLELTGQGHVVNHFRIAALPGQPYSMIQTVDTPYVATCSNDNGVLNQTAQVLRTGTTAQLTTEPDQGDRQSVTVSLEYVELVKMGSQPAPDCPKPLERPVTRTRGFDHHVLLGAGESAEWLADPHEPTGLRLTLRRLKP